MTTEVEWKPPYCANDENVMKCPFCGEESVNVRHKEVYLDTDCCEAYCAECHADLEVQVCVEITFSDPECAHSDCGLPGAICGHPAKSPPETSVDETA
jgi:hypothetical protein